MCFQPKIRCWLINRWVLGRWRNITTSSARFIHDFPWAYFMEQMLTWEFEAIVYGNLCVGKKRVLVGFFGRTPSIAEVVFFFGLFGIMVKRSYPIIMACPCFGSSSDTIQLYWLFPFTNLDFSTPPSLSSSLAL